MGMYHKNRFVGIRNKRYIKRWGCRLIDSHEQGGL